MAVALLAGATAHADGSGDYTRIIPRAPRPELSAVAIAPLCAAIAAKTVPSCPAFDAAKQFCTSPLNMAIPRPPTSELDALARATNQCPAVPAAAIRFNAATKAAGLLGIGWQDALVRGLAAFLVDRAKAEVLAGAADRFKKGLCGNVEGARLMPLTCAYLDTADPYKVPVSWGALKATVEKDLYELPLRVVSLEIRPGDDTLKDAPQLFYVAIDVAEQILFDKHDPVALLVGLQDKYAKAAGDCAKQPAGCALLGAGIAGEVILPGYTDTAAKVPNFIPIAARLIADQAVAAGLVPANAQAALATNLTNGLGPVLHAVENALAQGAAAHADKDKDKAGFDVRPYALALTSIPTTMTGMFATTVGLTPGQQAAPDAAIAIWTQLLQAARDKDYIAASVQLILILKSIQGPDLPPWTQYMPLLAELAQAKTSDDVQHVVEQLAAPVGSWRGKRGAGNRKLTLNGYLGAQAGWEWLGGGGIPKAPSFQTGVFAPIGFESSWGFGKSSSIGVLLSVIDLGAVVNFRTSSDTTTHGTGMDTVTVEQSPQIGLSQVFSPGLYVVYGIPCCPFALGVGGALSPELRSVTFTSTGVEEHATAFRVGAFLAVDVTIFPF